MDNKKDEQLQKCLKCEYCTDDDEALYCDLPQCKYNFTFSNFLWSLLENIINFIEIFAIAGLGLFGLACSLKLFNLSFIELGLGLILFIPVYGIWWLIDWRRNK